MFALYSLHRLQKDMEHFSLKVRYREVVLRTAADIVQHSFIVQDSISPLNLDLSRSYILLDKHTNNNLPSFSYSKDFINSEEKCRKVFTSGRSLLYTLHLDIPKDKERSLKSDCISNNDSLHCRKREYHIAAICIEDNFYTKILTSHIGYACNRTDQSMKVLKWFIKSNVFRKSGVTCLPANILNRIADCMHPELYDSEFLKGCFGKLNSSLTEFLFTGEIFKLGKRINFICQFHRTGRMSETMVWFEAHVNPSSGDLDEYMREENLKYIKSKPPRRHCLLLQVLAFYMYKFVDPEIASEFLRVAWSSIADSFLSSREIAAAIEKTVCSATVADICNFYSEAVGELLPYVEPRPLQHYCRTLIRRKLYGETKWVPDGIKELGLPKQIQSYLNLDK